MEALGAVDTSLKIMLAAASLGAIVFTAGRAWAVVSKISGSTEALHRRMTEEQQERRRRDETIDSVLMQIRLDIKGIQTWKQTLRFKPQPEIRAGHEEPGE